MIVTIDSITEAEKGKKVEGNKDDGKRVTFYVNSRTEQEYPFDRGTYEVLVKKFGEKYWATEIKLHEEGHLVKAAKAMGAEVVEKPKSTQDKMTTDMWDAKEARTRKSIERQKSLELIVNLVIADKIPLQEASTWVIKFEKYLESGK